MAGGVFDPTILILVLKEEKKNLGGGVFFIFWGVGGVPPPKKIVINLPGPMRSYPVKENHISSAVSEILRYRQKKLTTLYNTSGFAPSL